MNSSQSQLSAKDLEELENKDSQSNQSDNNQQIQQFKVILKNLPQIQKHKWSNRKYSIRQGVQSLSNLECIVENSLEDTNIVNSMNEIENLDYIDNVDSNQDDSENDDVDDYVDYVKPIYSRNDSYNELINFNSQLDHQILNSKALNSNLTKSPILTISNLSAQMSKNQKTESINNAFISDDTTTTSNLHKINKQTYQSNLNKFNNQNIKSNYKRINSDDNDNFFFGSTNNEINEIDDSSRNRKILIRQRFCDFCTIFLIITAFISIFIAVILLFLIALDAWSMQLAFTITLILLCILTVVFVLFASFTANFVWFYNSNINSIDWMLSYGRKNFNVSDYYFGKSLRDNQDEENNNEIKSNLIEQV